LLLLSAFIYLCGLHLHDLLSFSNDELGGPFGYQHN
jgi:hypothetical protein